MKRDQIHENFPKLSTPPEGLAEHEHVGSFPSTQAPLSTILLSHSRAMFNKTICLTQVSLRTIRSFQVTPREAKTNLLVQDSPNFLCASAQDFPLNRTSFSSSSPLSLVGTLSYCLHPLYTMNYRKILWFKSLSLGFHYINGRLWRNKILNEVWLSELLFAMHLKRNGNWYSKLNKNAVLGWVP